TREETAASEAAVARGEYPERPYVLVSQPSVLDPSRAPAGQHVLWAYAHVPRGSDRDMTEAVTARISEFAPGFRDVILASTSHSATRLEHHNPNYIGGDIAAGSTSLRQLVMRPLLAADPWRAPADTGLYLCSASTPPGPGVHGVGGWRAALSALRHEYGMVEAPDLAPGPGPWGASGSSQTSPTTTTPTATQESPRPPLPGRRGRCSEGGS
ncbi:MAG: phytoene desaturase family protein, partial [Actinomycetota bacterium]